MSSIITWVILSEILLISSPRFGYPTNVTVSWTTTHTTETDNGGSSDRKLLVKESSIEDRDQNLPSNHSITQKSKTIGVSEEEIRKPSVYLSEADDLSLNDNLLFWESSVCGKQSLCNESLSTSVGLGHTCGGCVCSEDCHLYGDCCLDIVLEDSRPVSPKLSYTSCVSGTEDWMHSFGATRYRFVHRCPSGYGRRDIRHRCEEVQTDFKIDSVRVPVFSTKSRMNYLNADCAFCHEDGNQTLNWTMQLACSETFNFGRVSSRDDLLEALRKTNSCKVEFLPPKDSISRKCDSVLMTDSCSEAGKAETFYKRHEIACNLFRDPISVDGQFYRNIFCALCNGKRNQTLTVLDNMILPSFDKDEFGTMKPRRVPPFSIIFDLRGSSDSQRNNRPPTVHECPDGSVFIPKQGSCRPLTCSPGRFVDNHTCVDAFQTAKGVRYVLRFYTVPTAVPYYLGNLAAPFGHNQLRELVQNRIGLDKSFFHADYILDGCYIDGRRLHSAQVACIKVELQITVNDEVSQSTVEHRLISLYNLVWTFGGVTLFNKPVFHTEKQPKRLRVNCEEFPTPTDGHNCVKSTRHLRTNVGSSRPFILLTPLSRCNQITLYASEFSVDWYTSSLKTHLTEDLIPEGEYMIDDELRQARICVNFSGFYDTMGNSTDGGKNENRHLLTLIIMPISIVCLAMSFTLSLLTRGRHSLPGKITMAIVCSLFVAQLTFVVSGFAAGNKWACRLVGMAIHYFWLVVFAWKHVAAYHMYVTFVKPFSRKTNSQGTAFLRYSTYGFGIPFLIVLSYTGANLILSRSANTGYGEMQCFLNRPLNIGLAFVAPVTIVLFCNGYFFVRVLRVVRQMAEFERHSNRSNGNHNAVFVRMSIMLGFTWISGFLANIVDEEVMWYIFLALNAGTGIIIFLGQICNRQTFGELRMALGMSRDAKSPLSRATEYSETK